jgi:hypothetical protein
MASSSTATASLRLLLPSSSCRRRLLAPRASHSSERDAAVGRRRFIAHTAAVSPLLLLSSPRVPTARSQGLSEWERVPLPIDPGVVLLDIAFVPDEPSHGTCLILSLSHQARPHACTVELMHACPISPGFLLGTRQTILETKDGGNTWFPRSIPSAEDEDFNYRFNSVSFQGKEGWIIGKPAILLHTSDAGGSWERIPLSAQLPGNMVIKTCFTFASCLITKTVGIKE